MSPAKKSLTDELSQTELFYKIGDICTLVEDIQNAKDLLKTSLDSTLKLFEAKRGSIFIFDKNSTNLILESAIGMDLQEEDQIVKRMGEGVVGQVAKSKTPIFVSDLEQDDRFDNFKARNSYQTTSFICAPLMIKDELIGVINITDKESKSRFTEKDMQILDFLASQIALNYKRINLFNKFNSAIKETAKLKDKLGKTDQEAKHLKKQIFIHEKLATIGKLAGGIAHEFNNPLDGVMRYTNLCLDQTKDNEVVRGYLLEIKHGLDRMATIVRNLLSCSRNEIPTGNKISFETALERAINSLSTEIYQKKIKIEKDIEKNLITINDFGLEIVLKNIINNAIDAMDDNGKISIKACKDNIYLDIAISDTGKGIKEEDIGKIFEPFFTTKDIDKGCGLGLTIVGEIVKNYSGKINVESKEKKGTTFNIKLPIILNHENNK